MNEHFPTDSTIDRRPAGSPRKKDTPLVQGEVAQRLVLAELSVQVLIAHSKIARLWEQGFEETARLFEFLPLPTAEFDLANRHLKNALNYSRDGEFGAAAFELRTLRGCLQRL